MKVTNDETKIDPAINPGLYCKYTMSFSAVRSLIEVNTTYWVQANPTPPNANETSIRIPYLLHPEVDDDKASRNCSHNATAA